MASGYFNLISVMILITMMGCGPRGQTGVIPASPVERPEYVLVIHGGAGVITKENLGKEKEAAYKKALEEALTIGEDILKKGGNSLDAVTATVTFLEDNALFNAGKGAVFNHEGKNEMDASIMNGRNLMAGAVGGLHTIKNPILAARAVMEKSDHVLLVGAGAEKFAIEQGMETVDPAYFFTQQRWDALQQILDTEPDTTEPDLRDQKHGTVGAVALDKQGNLAAATSTGGMTNKKYNRIGDSPIIGAGTYADNATCAISCTGHGEYFIRYVVAHAVSAQMKYGGKTLQEAGDEMVHRVLSAAGGTGGLISVDKDGQIHMPFNTEGMYRGLVKPGLREVSIYKESLISGQE